MTGGFLHELDCEGEEDCCCLEVLQVVPVDWGAEAERRIEEVKALDPGDEFGRVMLNRAYLMRLYPTRAESAMAAILAETGYQFLSQEVIGRYIVDFYCPRLNLIVEVDGPIHRLQVAKDARRQRWIQKQGYNGIRFTNDDVLLNRGRVLSDLEAFCWRVSA